MNKRARRHNGPTVVWWNGNSGWVTFRHHAMELTEPPRLTSVDLVTWLEYRPHSNGPHELAGADGKTRPMTDSEIAEINSRCARFAVGGRAGWESERK